MVVGRRSGQKTQWERRGAQAKRAEGGDALNTLPSKMKGECAKRPG